MTWYMRIGTGLADRALSVAGWPEGARTRAARSTATEVMREVVMARTVGWVSNRPATGRQRVANAYVSCDCPTVSVSLRVLRLPAVSATLTTSTYEPAAKPSTSSARAERRNT